MRNNVMGLPAALPGVQRDVYSDSTGRVSWYEDGPKAIGTNSVPLILLHSINAAGSAYEVKPLYDYFRSVRPVYALEFPGFGHSARDNRPYSPRVMTDAIHLLVEVVRKKHGSVPVDAIALSLGCEYLARAAVERPESIGTVGMVCPTGFEKEAGSLAFSVSLERPRLMRLLAIRGVGRALFEVLTLRPVIRHFLRGTWGRRSVDEGLLEYDYLATHQPGAEYAPLRFVAGYLFSPDRDRLYRSITQPVWVVRGVRGDFVDYAGLKSMTQNPQWTVVTLRTGSLPHFELPQQFIHRFERWAAAVRPSAPKSGAVALFQ